MQYNSGHNIFKPCFFTSLTTSIGLFSLCLSDIKPVFNFGLYGGFAVIISFLSTFFLLPKLINIFPVYFKKSEKNEFSNSKLNQLGLIIYKFVVLYKKPFLCLFTFLILTSLFYVQNISFKENFLKQLQNGHPFSKSAHFFKERLKFSGQIDLILIQKRDYFLKPEIESWEKSLREKLLAHPLVEKVLGLTAFKEDLQQRSKLSLENLQILDQFSFFEKLLPSSSDESRVLLNINSQDSDDLKGFIQFVENNLKNPYFEIKIDGYSKVRYTIMKFLFSTFYGSFLLSFLGIFLVFYHSF